MTDLLLHALARTAEMSSLDLLTTCDKNLLGNTLRWPDEASHLSAVNLQPATVRKVKKQKGGKKKKKQNTKEKKVKERTEKEQY